MDPKKFLVWLAVVVVLLGCFVGSCLLAGWNLSPSGRGFWNEVRREADKIGEGEKRAANERYNLSYGEDGAAYFSGGGFELTLPSGYAVKTPEGRSGEAPPFEYFLESGDGRIQLRLRREADVPGEDFWFGGERRLLFAHAETYAERVAGKAALEAAPPAYLAPSRLEASLADVGVEGCYRYKAEERERQGYDGEYFVFLGRGYDNVILASVAFRPFSRERSLAAGRKLVDKLRFN